MTGVAGHLFMFQYTRRNNNPIASVHEVFHLPLSRSYGYIRLYSLRSILRLCGTRASYWIIQTWSCEKCLPSVEKFLLWSSIYVVGEVFPWGGNSVIFSVCASISRTGVQLHEIDIWLDPRSLNEFYDALMFPKVNIIVTLRRLQVKWSKLRLQWIGLGFELGLA